MRRFGYLDGGGSGGSSTDNEALYSHEAVEDAIKKVQLFGSIPQTGKLDEATKRLLRSPRCGNKDLNEGIGKRRRKRYIIGSQGWKMRKISYQ